MTRYGPDACLLPFDIRLCEYVESRRSLDRHSMPFSSRLVMYSFPLLSTTSSFLSSSFWQGTGFGNPDQYHCNFPLRRHATKLVLALEIETAFLLRNSSSSSSDPVYTIATRLSMLSDIFKPVARHGEEVLRVVGMHSPAIHTHSSLTKVSSSGCA